MRFIYRRGCGNVNRKVRLGLRWHVNKDPKEVREWALRYFKFSNKAGRTTFGKEEIASRRIPRWVLCLVCLRNNKEASVAGAESQGSSRRCGQTGNGGLEDIGAQVSSQSLWLHFWVKWESTGRSWAEKWQHLIYFNKLTRVEVGRAVRIPEH